MQTREPSSWVDQLLEEKMDKEVKRSTLPALPIGQDDGRLKSRENCWMGYIDALRELIVSQENEVQKLKGAASSHLGQLNHWRKAYDEKEGERATAAKRAYRLERSLAARDRRIFRLLQHIERKDAEIVDAKDKRQRVIQDLAARSRMLDGKVFSLDQERNRLLKLSDKMSTRYHRLRSAVDIFFSKITCKFEDGGAEKAYNDHLRTVKELDQEGKNDAIAYFTRARSSRYSAPYINLLGGY